MEKEIPVTEQQNNITKDIDGSNSEEIVEKLEECDRQIFTGWQGYPSVFSSRILTILKCISSIASQHLQPGRDRTGIILSGCGTSGRLAFFISRKFNQLAEEQGLRQCYHYIISGGDKALMTSVESCEDDWNAGKEDLERVAEGFDEVLYIGITCGLSAPFVGGQVEYCLDQKRRFTPYLLGFNPVNQARNAPISGTDKVMLGIAKIMEDKGHLLNPIVGPEAITGSSRMKCGTTTKMILEAIFITAHQSAANNTAITTVGQKPSEPYEFMEEYKRTLEFTYAKNEKISSLINMAGEGLTKGGCVSYIAWGSLGIMGMIDAAECVPTFGANHDDVRCFIESGYKFLGNSEGDLSMKNDAYQISFDYFIKKRCPDLSENDTVIFIINSLESNQIEVLGELADLVRIQKVKLALIAINTRKEDVKKVKDKLDCASPTVHIVLPSVVREKVSSKYDNFVSQCTAEVSLKWVINAISTGAHILKGKVFQNNMIDLKLTNGKLFERGVRIVSGLANVSSETAKMCLLKSIYRQDKLRPDVMNAEISQHIQKAGYEEKVIPLAILLVKGFRIESGLKKLEECPRVRQCIEDIQLINSQH
ncbi:glucokinase regulatory protein-like [Dendronephthya gigantea]|uniref:glucokinase regulatory protein-like n=1 Tax=Dendronephthya gigantea TaxID=151771 RepID=UPI00106C73CF|nr:glucokinase regulatory protein-like [Dendronephthya gigantea]